MIWKPLQGPKMSVYWHVLQTYSAAGIIYERFMREIHPAKSALVTYNSDSDLRVEFRGGRNIFFKSGDNFENLRTESLAGAIIDEARQQSPLLWPTIIRPMLAKSKGWGDLLTTPDGFDWVYDLYNEAKLNPTEWGVIHAPSTEAWWWTPHEIESIKKSMTEAQFAQEIMAEFRDLTAGRAYPNFGDWNLSEQNPFAPIGIMHPQLPLGISMDFNLNPMAWTIGQKRVDQFYWFDEVWLKHTHTQESAKLLCHKIIEHMGIEKAKQIGVILGGDSSSKSAQRAAAGQSDYDIVCQALDNAGIKWLNVTPEANPGIKDRVNTVNAKLKNAEGTVSMWFHPTGCPRAVRDMQRVVWKPSASGVLLDQMKDTDLTHSSDGIGYFVHALSPLKYDETVPTMRVLMR